jgi:hypothetical protein
MRLPLRLQPQTSRRLFAAVITVHLCAAAAVTVTVLPWALKVFCLLLIGASPLLVLRRLRLDLPRSISLRQDGTMEVERADGQIQVERIGNAAVALPWLVVLSCEYEGQQRRLVLPADSLDAEAHRSLRLWLRYRTKNVFPESV